MPGPMKDEKGRPTRKALALIEKVELLTFKNKISWVIV
jgi:hypothetical protein